MSTQLRHLRVPETINGQSWSPADTPWTRLRSLLLGAPVGLATCEKGPPCPPGLGFKGVARPPQSHAREPFSSPKGGKHHAPSDGGSQGESAFSPCPALGGDPGAVAPGIPPHTRETQESGAALRRAAAVLARRMVARQPGSATSVATAVLL
eukprot:scaffold7347_cov112-Isochrysis_galbana.AAC.2